MKKMKRLAIILTSALIPVVAGCGSSENEIERQENRRAASVKVVKVKKSDIASYIFATGTISPVREARIGPKVEGRIEKIFVNEGDSVKKGQPLIRLEQSTYLSAKNEASASLGIARSRLKKTRLDLKNVARDYKRLSNLWAEKGISEQKYDKILTDYSIAQAELNLAEAQLKEAAAGVAIAEENLKDTVTYAPFSGFVVEKLMQEGEVSNWVTYLWNVLHLVDISKVKIECHISENKLVFLQVGKEVELEVDSYPGKIFSEKITVINPKIDPINRTFLIKIKISNPDFKLRGGMFCRVKIAKQEKKGVLQVPKESL
ncbi:MAG: efflux RND transporter periplasmic adaptor subunit, partial [Deltaproteobacteria bacterium]|nr:efflux RND transporter periplasmic adaptor subunit [Deltaproteobacteria bacterium]